MKVVKVGDKEAIQAAKSNRAEWTAKVEEMSRMSFVEMEDYIESNVKDLASAKAYLKKLSKVVLAQMKLGCGG